MEPRKFEEFIGLAASLSQRQRADLAAMLNLSSLQERTAALIETRAQLRHCLARVVERDILLVTDGHPAYRAFAREAGQAPRRQPVG